MKTDIEMTANIKKHLEHDKLKLAQKETAALRDTFAGLAMQALVGDCSSFNASCTNINYVSAVTYLLADAMLVAREAKGGV